MKAEEYTRLYGVLPKQAKELENRDKVELHRFLTMCADVKKRLRDQIMTEKAAKNASTIGLSTRRIE